jgi:hypothetical protein
MENAFAAKPKYMAFMKLRLANDGWLAMTSAILGGKFTRFCENWFAVKTLRFDHGQP